MDDVREKNFTDNTLFSELRMDGWMERPSKYTVRQSHHRQLSFRMKKYEKLSKIIEFLGNFFFIYFIHVYPRLHWEYRIVYEYV